MSFLSRKKRARVDAPWWNSQDFARTNRSITPGSLVVLAIIAGLVGGALGINASGGLLGGKANLVTA